MAALLRYSLAFSIPRGDFAGNGHTTQPAAINPNESRKGSSNAKTFAAKSGPKTIDRTSPPVSESQNGQALADTVVANTIGIALIRNRHIDDAHCD